MSSQQEENEVLKRWTDRNLTRAAKAGQLSPAYCMEDILGKMGEVITSGAYPVLVGEPGIGKTALIHELVRQGVAGRGPLAPGDKQVLQFSFRRQVSRLKRTETIGEVMEELVEELVDEGKNIIPYFSDLSLAYQLDLESELLILASSFGNPILGEGFAGPMRSMLEYTPNLEQHFIQIHMEEPAPDRANSILTGWARDFEARERKPFRADAIELAVSLSHRFITRHFLPRKAIDLLHQSANFVPAGQEVTTDGVLDRFCGNHRVPRFLVDSNVPLDLDEMGRAFRADVLGQEDAVDAVTKVIALVKGGLADPRRPFGVFLFVGPTGVGKTHVAQFLAQYLFGDRDRLVRLNMADYGDADGYDTLFGNANRDGNAQRGVLTRRIMQHPFAVLLLDELDKAHADVLDGLLQLIDEGAFINGAGEKVSCRSTIIICTSNAGAEIYRGSSVGFTSGGDMHALDRRLDMKLEESFRFEFLNRFDRVVYFHPLPRSAIRTIALREIQQLEKRPGFCQRRCHLEVDESVLDWLAVHGYDPDYGARFLKRAMERNVTATIAETFVRENPPRGSTLTVTVRRGRIEAMVYRPRPAPTRQPVSLPVGTERQKRNLDSSALLEEADRLLHSAKPRLEALEQRRAERSRLLEKMNETGFWNNSPGSRQVLEEFRALDVTIAIENRLAAPVAALSEKKQETEQKASDLKELAQALEGAADALHEWQNRVAEEGAGVCWLLVSNVDPMRPAAEWVEQVAEMERQWCQRLDLAAQAIAYVESGGHALQVALEVEGLGAASLLRSEAGHHRLHRSAGGTYRARVELIRRGPPPDADWPGLRTIPVRNGFMNLPVECVGEFELSGQGRHLDFLGYHRPTLNHFLHDLRIHRQQDPDGSPEVARIYGEGGSGARDPRTGVSAPNLKDVLKGRLDHFLEAWQQAALSNL